MIEMKNNIRFEHVVSIRKQLTQDELEIAVAEFNKVIQKKKLVPSGPFINTTYSAKQIVAGTLFDVELLLPVNKKTALPKGYSYKSTFEIPSAVYARHEGGLENMQETAQKMINYIKENGLQPITTLYNATAQSVDQEQTPYIDMYIGVAGSSLAS